jgi:hypothetical protein
MNAEQARELSLFNQEIATVLIEADIRITQIASARSLGNRKMRFMHDRKFVNTETGGSLIAEALRDLGFGADDSEAVDGETNFRIIQIAW